MTGSPVFASAEADADRVLICVPNWLGDAVMCLPALQDHRSRFPGRWVTLLVKPRVAPLMACHAAHDELLVLPPGRAGTFGTARLLAGKAFDRAVVLPNSFRSALIPFLARIPRRRGVAKHGRRLLLNDVVPTGVLPQPHQAFENYRLLLPGELPAAPAPPVLKLGAEDEAAVERVVGGRPRPWVALVPGAARGPAKTWPAAHFAEVGRRWAETAGATVLVLGAPNEATVGEEVAAAVGSAALNLAGKTGVGEWMALLAASDLVVANDSGGAHVGAALGTPVVAIFGMTDPAKTAPMGPKVTVVQDGGPHGRDLPRDSAEARKRLASIPPDRVYEATRERLQWAGR